MTFDFNTALDILKVAVGLIYLYLEYHARPAMWIASVIMPVIGMVLFFNKGLYADFGINIYYLVIAVYGWYVWTRGAKHKGEVNPKPITHITPLAAAGVSIVWLCVWALIAWILATFTDSTVVMLDSLTTSLSIAGMWMLARKYAEQWLVWLVVDAIYVWLYWHKGIYFSGTLYLFYTFMAVAGYLKWRKMIVSSEKKGQKFCDVKNNP